MRDRETEKGIKGGSREEMVEVRAQESIWSRSSETRNARFSRKGLFRQHLLPRDKNSLEIK